MAHEPRRLVAHVQHAHQLVAGNAFLRGREQVGGVNPLVQGNMAALKHGAHGHAKGLLALAALVHALAGALALQFVNALKSALPQCGQNGPWGQSSLSRCLRAAVSSV